MTFILLARKMKGRCAASKSSLCIQEGWVKGYRWPRWCPAFRGEMLGQIDQELDVGILLVA